ncbi:hypothetical protein Gpo141_00011036, partial [Globisporangium polare]
MKTKTTFDIVCGVPLDNIDRELAIRFMDYAFASITVRFLFKPYFQWFYWCMPSEYRYKREA